MPEEISFDSGVLFLNHRATQIVGDELADGLVAPRLTQPVLVGLVRPTLRPQIAVEHPLDDAEDRLDFCQEPIHFVVLLPVVVVQVRRFATEAALVTRTHT